MKSLNTQIVFSALFALASVAESQNGYLSFDFSSEGTKDVPPQWENMGPATVVYGIGWSHQGPLMVFMWLDEPTGRVSTWCEEQDGLTQFASLGEWLSETIDMYRER